MRAYAAGMNIDSETPSSARHTNRNAPFRSMRRAAYIQVRRGPGRQAGVAEYDMRLHSCEYWVMPGCTAMIAITN